MSVNPQPQSSFITRLPREVRDAIYLELWRSFGLRQHIVSHWDWDHSGPRPKATGAHFCRWTCTTEFDVEDKLQEEIELLRIRENVAIGDTIHNDLYSLRLQSAWLNHWECGERVEEIYGEDARAMDVTSGGHCWTTCSPKVDDPPPPKPEKRLSRLWGKAKETAKLRSLLRKSKGESSASAVSDKPLCSPYMPMLLSCKLLSGECLESIYASITFIFTDVLAWQMFVGFCEPHPSMEGWAEDSYNDGPPAFPKYAKKLELSLSPTFPCDVTCTTSLLSTRSDHLHSPYDFHWLQLDRFERLSSIKIWVPARVMKLYRSNVGGLGCVKFDDMNVEALKEALSSFKNIREFVLSSPLHKDIEPEDGYVEGITQKDGHQVWKRGIGDVFHPSLEQTFGMGRPSRSIWTFEKRYVFVNIYPRTVSHVCFRPVHLASL